MYYLELKTMGGWRRVWFIYEGITEAMLDADGFENIGIHARITDDDRAIVYNPTT